MDTENPSMEQTMESMQIPDGKSVIYILNLIRSLDPNPNNSQCPPNQLQLQRDLHERKSPSQSSPSSPMKENALALTVAQPLGLTQPQFNPSLPELEGSIGKYRMGIVNQ